MMLSSKFCFGFGFGFCCCFCLRKGEKIGPKMQGETGELTFIAWPNMF